MPELYTAEHPYSSPTGLRVRQDLIDEEYTSEDYEKMLPLYEQTMASIVEGEIVKSKVLRVTDNAVILDVGFKSEGSISRDEFVKFLGALHGKLGSFKSGKTTGWNVNVGTGGHMVTLTREAQFEKGPGTEQFVFRVQGERAVLAGYHVNSRLLIIG